MFEQPDARRLLDDELRVVHCQLGEPAAFDALIARWHPSLLANVRRQGGSDDIAEDIVQDVGLRVLRGIAGLRTAADATALDFEIAALDEELERLPLTERTGRCAMHEKARASRALFRTGIDVLLRSHRIP